MHFAKLFRNSRAWLLPRLVAVGFLLLSFARAQESPSPVMTPRADRPEISITVRDSGGALIATAGTVKLLLNGSLTDEAGLSHGRAFFSLNTNGDYTLVVDATGYKSAQKEVNISIAMPYEVEVNLRPDTAPDDTPGVPAKPLLAPKAKQALDKSLQALSKSKLSEAEKYLDEAMKLAPSHPDVLYVQGVFYLNQRNWVQAQSALEKASQLDPTSSPAFSALGMALEDQGKYDQAIAPLERSLELDAAAWEPRWWLGKAYYHLQRYDDALKASELALKDSNGKAPQIELLVAQALTAVGQYEEAAQTLRDFLKRHADRPEVATAQRWLDGLASNGKIHPK